MGQNAEDMDDGTTCSWCGMFFEYPPEDGKPNDCPTHGYPVVCRPCFKAWPHGKRRLRSLGLQVASYPLM